MSEYNDNDIDWSSFDMEAAIASAKKAPQPSSAKKDRPNVAAVVSLAAGAADIEGSMPNKRRAESECPLDVPVPVIGDPNVTWEPIFGNIGSNGHWYLNNYEKYCITDKDRYITLQSYFGRGTNGQSLGDNGRTHRYIIDKKLVESRSVWFGESYMSPKATIAKEVEIKEEDDAKLYFISVKNGQFVNRERYEREEKEYEQKKKDDNDLLDKIKYWIPDTCHESIALLRQNYNREFEPPIGFCCCGIATTERRIWKKNSSHCGKTFYGCSLFPGGCGHFELSDERKQKLRKEMD